MPFQSEVNPDNGWSLDDDNNKLDIRWMKYNNATKMVILEVLFSLETVVEHSTSEGERE